MHQLQRSLLVVALLALVVSGLDAAEGLVKEKPKTGPFVKTEMGYMVPYKMTIPGTEAEFEMVPIPGGRFQFGSPENEADRNDDEGPQTEIQVEAFWMGKYEITWSEYKEFMGLYEVFKLFQQKKLRPVNEKNLIDAITAPTELYEPTFTFELGEDPQQPAATMTQYAAKQYTKWLSAVSGHQYRLPLEVEWEYACRAGTKTRFHFGDDATKLGEYAWYRANSEEKTQLVGQKKPNPWGLHDMHGNVAEWVLDQYEEDGYGHLAGKKWKATDTYKKPTKLYPRAVRGGHWDDEASECRSASRLASHDEDWKGEDPNFPLSPWWFTSDPSRGVGFRLLRPLRRIPRRDMEKFWEADVAEVVSDVDSRIQEGRGALGLVDRDLPAAMKKLAEDK